MKKWDAGSLAILLMAYIMGILFGMIRQQLESADTMIEVESQSKAQDVAWKKQVAITFDDGPNPNYTVKLLDGLKKRGVKATFFLLGSEVEQYPEIVEAIHENGHLIGVHSYEHVNFGQIGDAAAVEQIDRTQEAIYDVTGEYAGYIRPPYGCWKKELDTEVPMIEVLWDVDPLDWATTDADTVVQRILSDVEDGSVILLHDASESSVQAALTTIDILQEQEYEFVTVEELLLE
ncbi:MAG: polysaccharide deacetylase family protein [Lachnospiraceae bacterium]|nr:polysaccharide deacetylase family protein [Agathobacter sp.]MDD6291012.1 polysaccharide deacetylase family protein [Lachnospiraceae bacterium]